MSDHERMPTGLGLGTLPERFLLVYPIVFMLPFPLTLLRLLHDVPGFSESFLAAPSSWLMDLHGQATQPIVAWLGRLLTGETPSFEFTGSGDGLASYLGVLLDSCVATVIALMWWLWHRSKPVSPRIADACRVLLRYFLVWVMLSYGFSKFFPTQFPVMGPDRLLQPYGDSSPMGLLWTFMGASPGYQIFAGAAELLGGFLLLFRRTTLLGALVVAAVMTNVFAMNMFFDVPVKLYSFHYLLFAVFLVIPDAPRLFGIFVANVPVAARDLRPFWHGSLRWHRAFGIAKTVLIVALCGTHINSRVERMRSRGLWAPPNELHGIYRVESFDVSFPDPGDETEIPDDIRWLQVGIHPPFGVTVQRADGTTVRLRMKHDDDTSMLALFARGVLELTSDPLTLERLDDRRIRLNGVFDEVPIDVILRLDPTERPFTTGRFRWISEYPFNR